MVFPAQEKLHQLLSSNGYVLSEGREGVLHYRKNDRYFRFIYDPRERMPYFSVGNDKCDPPHVVEIDNYTLESFFRSEARIKGLDTFADNITMFFNEEMGILLLKNDPVLWTSLCGFALMRARAYTDAIIKK